MPEAMIFLFLIENNYEYEGMECIHASWASPYISFEYY
jgi:hypothetical protein